MTPRVDRQTRATKQVRTSAIGEPSSSWTCVAHGTEFRVARDVANCVVPHPFSCVLPRTSGGLGLLFLCVSTPLRGGVFTPLAVQVRCKLSALGVFLVIFLALKQRGYFGRTCPLQGPNVRVAVGVGRCLPWKALSLALVFRAWWCCTGV